MQINILKFSQKRQIVYPIFWQKSQHCSPTAFEANKRHEIRYLKQFFSPSRFLPNCAFRVNNS
jgi:hypothetical protein